MKYTVSPLNLFCAIVLGVLIVQIIEPAPRWGLWRIVLYLVPVIIISLLIDYFMQKYSDNHFYTCIIQTILIIIFVIVNANILYG